MPRCKTRKATKAKKATKKISKTKKTKKVKKIKIPAKLIKYLEKAGVKYDVLEHKTVFTAIDAAATMKRKLNEIAKSLLVKADKNYYIVVVPADNNVNFEKLGKIISKKEDKDIKVVKIPSEKIMEKVLKVKAGAISAFGSLYKLPVIVDKKLTKIKKAVFSGGSFNYSIEMAVKDFVKLEDALLGSFSIKKKIKKSIAKTRKAKKTKKQKTSKKKK